MWGLGFAGVGFGLGVGVWIFGLGFGVWRLGFGISEIGVWCSILRVWGGGVLDFRRIISRLDFRAWGLWALRLRVQRLGLVASSLGFRPLGAAFRDALPFEPVFVFVFVFVFGAGLWRPVFVFGFSVFGVGCLAFPVKPGSGFGAGLSVLGLGFRVYASGISVWILGCLGVGVT